MAAVIGIAVPWGAMFITGHFAAVPVPVGYGWVLPLEDDNQKMISLEDTIENNIENDGALRHVYSRTGNDLKELIYYGHDQDWFL